MAERTVVIASRVGLHARPAMLFTQAVAASGANITIARPGGPSVDASSILVVMGLGVKNGDEVVITGENEAILDDLAGLLATDLDAA
jgi:phosphocarrier protein HPr